eukprot:CAMPEP_0174383270 /NCGR_PEP_ID=MMETSP0811_2-20130205/125114_1 /TAXON_ID=73025 ORGANISM="Eutreptiella gymnastica-like, Strain CCMP1594" /NCGR_SAMPLE_ID=MMETSP0811_2 /ASSEMBLY_ACC=CAM_ASM_000667 /LENGTH=114 /DNA_ID=CAMNT_0015536785 /DNA_START=584 /DNA_END=928 /DNA_ORIENTATION=-
MNHPNSGFVRGTNELPIECWGMPRLMKRFKLREDGECMQSCRRAVSRSVLREQPRTICFDWRGILAACVEEDQEGSFFFLEDGCATRVGCLSWTHVVVQARMYCPAEPLKGAMC